MSATLILEGVSNEMIRFFTTVIIAVWKRGIDGVTHVLSQSWRGALDLGIQQNSWGEGGACL